MNKRFTVKKMVTIGILAAISIILVYLIKFPIFPVAPFLEYDPADIPIFICTLVLGPIEGLVLTLIVCIIQGITISSQSGIIGIMMHFFATGSFVLIAGLVHNHKRTTKRLVIALLAGVLTWQVTMVLWNLVFTPIFLGTPFKEVVKLLPIIIIFNLIKAGVNAGITMLVYKGLQKSKINEI